MAMHPLSVTFPCGDNRYLNVLKLIVNVYLTIVNVYLTIVNVYLTIVNVYLTIVNVYLTRFLLNVSRFVSFCGYSPTLAIKAFFLYVVCILYTFEISGNCKSLYDRKTTAAPKTALHTAPSSSPSSIP